MKTGSHQVALRAMQRQGLWDGSFNGKESSLHQLSPYVGKLKSGIVHTLITHFSRSGEWVCDPFAGSGVVPLESVLLGRKARANDLNPYAVCLTRGKLNAPCNLQLATRRADGLIQFVKDAWQEYDLRQVPFWVRGFFHPRTLKEVLAAFDYCRVFHDPFLAACLCGILHHQRPGFLSYPASHMVPYLRTSLFPRKQFPKLYEYRSLAERLVAKVERAYRRPNICKLWSNRDYEVTKTDARRLPYRNESIDLILTSPPYYGTLDYARDNRLRLWFLGEVNWERLDSRLISRVSTYESNMSRCLKEMYRILKRRKYCVLIVGEVQCNGKTRDTGTVLGAMAAAVTDGAFEVDCVVEDEIPDIRRSRRGTTTARVEKILVLRKIR